jgi:hypothetical protein
MPTEHPQSTRRSLTEHIVEETTARPDKTRRRAHRATSQASLRIDGREHRAAKSLH